MSEIRIGTVGSPAMLSGDWARRQELVSQVEESGIDHLFIADHVSFHTGLGMDGLVNAATLAAMSPRLGIVIGVYLLALRHPVTVARQLSSLSASAPGRITLGIGVGGEDRHEMEVCGVDPARRGEHTNHSLAALGDLMSGQASSYHCDFFSYDDAIIKPAPGPAIPIIVGGRSERALVRTARYGDGWLGVWCSARRFSEVVSRISEKAVTFRETVPEWQHGLQVWAGFNTSRARARELLASEMEAMYRIPFEKFERYSPFGSPREVADFLIPYCESGAHILNIKPCTETEEEGIEAVAEVRRLVMQG